MTVNTGLQCQTLHTEAQTFSSSGMKKKESSILTSESRSLICLPDVSGAVLACLHSLTSENEHAFRGGNCLA